LLDRVDEALGRVTHTRQTRAKADRVPGARITCQATPSTADQHFRNHPLTGQAKDTPKSTTMPHYGHRFFKAEMPPASNVKAGGEIRRRQATAILELTLFAALAMSAATASGFDI
jgi:hypothetical protein